MNSFNLRILYTLTAAAGLTLWCASTSAKPSTQAANTQPPPECVATSETQKAWAAGIEQGKSLKRYWNQILQGGGELLDPKDRACSEIRNNPNRKKNELECCEQAFYPTYQQALQARKVSGTRESSGAYKWGKIGAETLCNQSDPQLHLCPTKPTESEINNEWGAFEDDFEKLANCLKKQQLANASLPTPEGINDLQSKVENVGSAGTSATGGQGQAATVQGASK